MFSLWPVDLRNVATMPAVADPRGPADQTLLKQLSDAVRFRRTGRQTLGPATAHSIGKLFQKRLVGRPAWIGDGRQVATLRKSIGHNENTYRVEVAVPAGRSQVGECGERGNARRQ